MTTLTFPHLNIRAITLHPLALVILIALGLRLLLLNQAALWYDETGSVWMASLPFAKMLEATGADTHPPLYLALLWVWIRLFGTSEAVVRLPSVVLSLAAIVLTWRIGERLGLQRPALVLAAALMAINPAQIYFAQEVRMYALLTVEVLIGLLAALERRWIIFGLALAASYWTHNYGLIFAVPLNVAALVSLVKECRETKTRLLFSKPATLWLGANALAVGSWLPWLTVLVGQMRDVAAGYWIPPLVIGAPLDALFKTVWGIIITNQTQAHALLVLAGAVVFAIGRAIWLKHRTGLVLSLLVIAPYAIVVLASVAWKPIMLFRGFMPAAPLLMLLFGWAFTHELPTRARLVAAAFALPVIAGVLTGYYLDVAHQKGDPQSWTELMDWREGDVLYHINEGSYMALHFYTPATWPQAMLPRGDWRNLGALSDRTKQAMGFNIARLESLHWKRAWLMQSTGPTTTAGEDAAIADLLARYPHLVIRLDQHPLSTFALYLLYNPDYAR